MALHDDARMAGYLCQTAVSGIYVAQLEAERRHLLHCSVASMHACNISYPSWLKWPTYELGSVHKQPLADNFFTMKDQVLSPFQGVNAVEQFQGTLGIDVANPGPAVFTYNDLVACNILVRKNSPKLAAIIDWGQAWMVSCILGVLQGATHQCARRPLLS